MLICSAKTLEALFLSGIDFVNWIKIRFEWIIFNVELQRISKDLQNWSLQFPTILKVRLQANLPQILCSNKFYLFSHSINELHENFEMDSPLMEWNLMMRTVHQTSTDESYQIPSPPVRTTIQPHKDNTTPYCSTENIHGRIVARA